MSYYINLSILSKNQKKLQRFERQKSLSGSARHILSICEGRPVTDDDIAIEESGRPFFLKREGKNRDTDFSISHSGALTAVSLVRGKNLRTGCDVEQVRSRAGAQAIAKEYFTPHERDYIESGGSFDIKRFYQIWTLKECYIKLRGGSVFDMPKAPSFIRCVSVRARCGGHGCEPLFEFFLQTSASSISFNLYELLGNANERYILATAIEGAEEQPEIRWFSQDSLDCKSIAKIKAAPNPAETVSPKI